MVNEEQHKEMHEYYVLKFVSVLADKKIACLREIRNIKNCGLKTAKAVMETKNSIIIYTEDKNTTESLKQAIEKVGGVIEVEKIQSEKSLSELNESLVGEEDTEQQNANFDIKSIFNGNFREILFAKKTILLFVMVGIAIYLHSVSKPHIIDYILLFGMFIYRYYRCSHHDRTCTNTSYISEKEMTSAFRRHLKRIALNEKLYELVLTSLKESLRDEQNFHKTELLRLNKEIEECTKTLKKMYLDQLNNLIDRDLWISIKNEYEMKLNQLNADLQKHGKANINYLDNGVRILDICHKASMPYTELKPETIAQIVWETHSSVKIQGKSVKMQFAEPFATLEKLVRLANQGIEKYGYDKFLANTKAQKDKCFESIKKEPEGSISICSICFKWWRLGDSNS